MFKKYLSNGGLNPFWVEQECENNECKTIAFNDKNTFPTNELKQMFSDCLISVGDYAKTVVKEEVEKVEFKALSENYALKAKMDFLFEHSNSPEELKLAKLVLESIE